MEFWGVEVKPGVPHKVTFNEDRLVHLSQAALGETKKGSEGVVLFVNFEGKKLVLGTLSLDKCPQISYDLIFEKEFELSHNSKHGSVYFTGYKSAVEGDGPSDGSEEESESEDDIPILGNGKPEPIQDVKVGSSAAKPKVKIVEPIKDDESEDDDSEDSDEGESDDEVKQSKKRPAETSASKTPADKKAKLTTPQKSGADGKKGNEGHVATPHPAKKAGKSDKSKQETPKSAATPVACNTCSKTFNSEKGLESHTKAKHSS
ncbi:hypothetical protein MKW94_024266 [Papaver nudicaule]|uniref:C2H2-type domain-containing protein n=1 Tax=Papaver nudicaule TaxID=74823 RepID=A0AA42AVY2_PAPNU|nr:hypothetical protein [Papaver nudicaule]